MHHVILDDDDFCISSAFSSAGKIPESTGYYLERERERYNPRIQSRDTGTLMDRKREYAIRPNPPPKTANGKPIGEEGLLLGLNTCLSAV